VTTAHIRTLRHAAGPPRKALATRLQKHNTLDREKPRKGILVDLAGWVAGMRSDKRKPSRRGKMLTSFGHEGSYSNTPVSLAQLVKKG
jgi:hypothetical protein